MGVNTKQRTTEPAWPLPARRRCCPNKMLLIGRNHNARIGTNCTTERNMRLEACQAALPVSLRIMNTDMERLQSEELEAGNQRMPHKGFKASSVTEAQARSQHLSRSPEGSQTLEALGSGLLAPACPKT